MTKPSLLLVGYGRFGAFAAGFLRRRFEVHVIERRRNRKLAPGVKKASAGDIGRFDLVVLAIPARPLKRFLTTHGRRIRAGAFVADLCAVKSAPMAWMRTLLPRNVSYAGLHPLFGPTSASRGLRGHVVAVCRGRSSASCHRRLRSILRSYGLKPVETDPATHDRTMASTLFLTQIMGGILPSPPTGRPHPFETPAFRHLDVVRRTAKGNPPGLIGELVIYNPYCRNVLGRMKGRFRRDLDRLGKISYSD